MNDTLSEKVQWLVDRALISELLFSFARALDTKDVDGYVNNYAKDGVLELPDPTSTTGETLIVPRSRMPEFVRNGIVKAYSARYRHVPVLPAGCSCRQDTTGPLGCRRLV
jgi:hypothetical protein